MESTQDIPLRGPLTTRWQRRALLTVGAVWVVAAVVPALLDLPPAWHAFGAGLIMPGAGLLYAIPPMEHATDTAMVVGHAVVLFAVAFALAQRGSAALRRVVLPVVALVAALVLAFVSVSAPALVVVLGHVAAFLAVLAAVGWAVGFRLVARADFVTLPAIVLLSAFIGAWLTSAHGGHEGPLSWIPWAALGLAAGTVALVYVREQSRYGAAQRLGAERAEYLREQRAAQDRPARTEAIPLTRPTGAPEVTEAGEDQLRLARWALSIGMQPVDEWSCFDPEGAGPLQQYRYQLDALSWALSMFQYAHTPSALGPVHQSQVDLFRRTLDKKIWGYWRWQQTLGAYDLLRRNPDPIGSWQNIMFSGYLDLRLGMFAQATGDRRFDEPGSLTFEWSPTERFAYDHRAIADIVARNFGGDLCLWPCEPLPSLRRNRGFVFPYCNAVALSGLAIRDMLDGTGRALDILPRFQQSLETEFTAADGDLATFTFSGVGLTARGFRGVTNTAGIAAISAPLLPDLAWRSWELLRKEWLETGRYEQDGSGAAESPTVQDWGSQANTNAEPLAAALLLAQEQGQSEWHAKLWQAAREQLDFSAGSDTEAPRFRKASVHATGMLALGTLGRPGALADMMSRPRPAEWAQGPRLAAVPHPDVLVAKAVSDGTALDVVLRPGREPGRFTMTFDQLATRGRYAVHGATEPEVVADEHGHAEVEVDVAGRTELSVRPV